GAGGVARSVLAALLEQNPARIIIVNRTSERARRLSRWGSGLDPAIEIAAMSLIDAGPFFSSKAVIVNCTPQGMQPRVDCSPLPEDYIHSGQTLIDTVYTPPQTRFLKTGVAAGARVIDGLDMFIGQGLASLDIWFGNGFTGGLELADLKRLLLAKGNN
ncbi:MAG: shikimate dehydrogenase, partial [Candidatus Neomarinimicrobiota bacterium]